MAKAPTYDEVKGLLTRHTCSACHQANKRQVGPAFADVAKRKYTNDQIMALIYNPKPTNWPDYATEMPPMPQVPKADALKIAAWINSLAPSRQQPAGSAKAVTERSDCLYCGGDFKRPSPQLYLAFPCQIPMISSAETILTPAIQEKFEHLWHLVGNTPMLELILYRPGAAPVALRKMRAL